MAKLATVEHPHTQTFCDVYSIHFTMSSALTAYLYTRKLLMNNFLVKLFRRRMQNYATLCDKFIHCVIRGNISPHFRRLIAVNDHFCGDDLIGI